MRDRIFFFFTSAKKLDFHPCAFVGGLLFVSGITQKTTGQIAMNKPIKFGSNKQMDRGKENLLDRSSESRPNELQKARHRRTEPLELMIL